MGGPRFKSRYRKLLAHYLCEVVLWHYFNWQKSKDKGFNWTYSIIPFLPDNIIHSLIMPIHCIQLLKGIPSSKAPNPEGP